MSNRPSPPGKSTYAAIYLRTSQGSWEGEVVELGVTAKGATLEDARRALATAVKTNLQTEIDSGAKPPQGIPDGTTTVADRMEVTVFSMGRGTKKLVTARSEPSHGPRRSPYLDKHGNHLLRESVVLVIDELGSTSMMTRGLTEQAISARAKLLADSREWLGERETDDLESVIVYTDNLVHGAPFNDSQEATARLGFTVSAAAHYQLELALGGTILRGGVAIGPHHQSESIVVGPALIEAHLLESQTAVFPRVLLSMDAFEIVASGLAEWARPLESPWATQILIDEDQQPFVSYLSASDEYDRGNVDRLLLIERHRDRVVAGMKSTAPGSGPRAKWEWAGAYHDYYVTANGLPKTLCTRKSKSWGRTFTSVADLLSTP